MQNLQIKELVNNLQYSDDCVADIGVGVITDLFTQQIDANLKKESGASLIALAALYQSSELLEMLGLDINVCNKTEDAANALMICSVNNSIHAVKFLIESGADVNAENSFGDTALPVAIFFGNLEIVKMLLAAGANPDARCEQGSCPLDIALLGFLDSAKLSSFAQLNEVYLDIALTLVAAGADVKEQDESGFTILDEVAHAESELQEYLLQEPVEMSQADKDSLASGIAKAIKMLQQFKMILKK